MSHYFLVSALPPLLFEQKPILSFDELRQMLEEQFSTQQLAQWHKLLLWFDLHNLRLLWKEQSIPFDTHAMFAAKSSLQEELHQQQILPDYLFDFMHQYATNKLRVQNFAQLLILFFQNERKNASRFLQQFFVFEREWRLILLGLRAKKTRRDLAIELEHEDPYDLLVAQLLAQKDSTHYDPPTDDPILRHIIVREQQGDLSPVMLYQELARYRFQRIGQFASEQLFSLDAILCYTAQLILLQQWHVLDKTQGHIIAENLLRNVI